MALIALNSASTGLSALSTALDITANNLANVNTDGFKSSRANFQDLLYIERAQAGAENVLGDRRPTGLYVGLGVRVSGTQVDFTQGAPRPTGRPLDLAIEGDGFFQVEVETDIGDGIAYTRAGQFSLNEDGEIVLITDQGRRLLPVIDVPEGATNITIARDGTVSVSLPGQIEADILDTIQLATFINPTGLEQIGENLYLPTTASGDAAVDDPRVGGRGSIIQGHLESSNVDPVKELVNLITIQRAFEMNSQSIQTADEALQTVSNLRRF